MYRGPFQGHIFESDRVGFFLAHLTSAFTGLVYFVLALVEMNEDEDGVERRDFNLSADYFHVAGHTASLLLLGSLSLHRVLLAISLHPFAQPLRAPIAAKTLLERRVACSY